MTTVERIICPSCERVQDAMVTVFDPGPSQMLSRIHVCGKVIMESEWEVCDERQAVEDE
jgi:hypothetical protein